MTTPRPHTLRIIGGKYKGKLIPVLAEEGLRPTPDRFRETIFNWLQGKLEHARVLDLFAGSGALGFEALSRGAVELTLVDLNASCCTTLKKLATDFDPAAIKIFNCAALSFLEHASSCYDVVFLDPPYKLKILEQVMASLLKNNLIHQNSLIYVEMRNGSCAFFPGWEQLRESCSGQVKATLWKKTSF